MFPAKEMKALFAISNHVDFLDTIRVSISIFWPDAWVSDVSPSWVEISKWFHSTIVWRHSCGCVHRFQPLKIHTCVIVYCVFVTYVFCICEYFNKQSFVTSDLLLMLLSVQQFQAEKRWFDEKPQGHAPGNNTNTNYSQGCTNLCSLAAGLRGNEERMRKWRGNGDRMRK